MRLYLMLLLLLAPTPALADPWFGWNEAKVEDRYNDGDVDIDDLGRRRGSIYFTLAGFVTQRPDQIVYGGYALFSIPLDRQVHIAEPPAPKPRPIVSPPMARACVNAAWRTAGLGDSDAALDAMASRARWSAILPELRLRAMRTADARAQVDDRVYDARYVDTVGNVMYLEGRMTWRLDRLIYADDEAGIERMRRERQDARQRVAARTLEALFHWQKAILELETSAPDTKEAWEAQLKAAEAAATLDVLTGGWFSARDK